MATRLFVCLIAGFMSLPALGQEPIPQSFLEELARDLSALQADQASQGLSFGVANDDVNVHAGISADTRVIGRLRVGDPAKVIGKAGGWYGVLLPDKQVGWVQTQDVSLDPEWDVRTLGGIRARMEAEKESDLTGYRWLEDQVLALLQRAAAFRDTYRDNPYVLVRGFDISLGLTGPTLGMSFEFQRVAASDGQGLAD